MEDIQDNILTNSDLEHLIDQIGPTNFPQFNVDQDFMNVPRVEEVMPVTGPLSSHSPTGTIPCRDYYPGPFQFEVLLNSTTSSRNSWVYSHKLNKVFIDMNKSLLIQFKLSSFEAGGLCVRALPVYSMSDYISEPVERCTLHVIGDDQLFEAHSTEPPFCHCARFAWVGHVVRSSHAQVQYHYDPDSSRHSVLVPLDPPQAGCDTATAEFQFACKTSCARGMNRRPIDLIFTLESAQGQVIGRQVLPVKICSCPKRDKEKEEADLIANGEQNSLTGRKRRAHSTDQQEMPKKVKVENTTSLKEVPVEKSVTQIDQQINNLSQLISSQATLIAEMRNELNCQREELHLLRSEMAEELHLLRSEMALVGPKISEMALVGPKIDALSNSVDAILQVLLQGSFNQA